MVCWLDGDAGQEHHCQNCVAAGDGAVAVGDDDLVIAGVDCGNVADSKGWGGRTGNVPAVG